MRTVIGMAVTGFLFLGLSPAGERGDLPDPEAIEAKLREVRKKLETLRAEERELAEQLAAANAAAPASIKAEVTGALRHDSKGGCYYISVRSANGETRVWLPPTDEKGRDQLGSLHGKAVVANGNMHQRYPARTVPYVWSEREVPEGAFYLWPYEISAPLAPAAKK